MSRTWLQLCRVMCYPGRALCRRQARDEVSTVQVRPLLYACAYSNLGEAWSVACRPACEIKWKSNGLARTASGWVKQVGNARGLSHLAVAVLAHELVRLLLRRGICSLRLVVAEHVAVSAWRCCCSGAAGQGAQLAPPASPAAAATAAPAAHAAIAAIASTKA